MKRNIFKRITLALALVAFVKPEAFALEDLETYLEKRFAGKNHTQLAGIAKEELQSSLSLGFQSFLGAVNVDEYNAGYSVALSSPSLEALRVYFEETADGYSQALKSVDAYLGAFSLMANSISAAQAADNGALLDASSRHRTLQNIKKRMHIR